MHPYERQRNSARSTCDNENHANSQTKSECTAYRLTSLNCQATSLRTITRAAQMADGVTELPNWSWELAGTGRRADRRQDTDLTDVIRQINLVTGGQQADGSPPVA
jgi:hypothetical protein